MKVLIVFLAFIVIGLITAIRNNRSKIQYLIFQVLELIEENRSLKSETTELRSEIKKLRYGKEKSKEGEA